MLTPAHVELYCRIKRDALWHARYSVEDALIYCEWIEIRLNKLEPWQRESLLLQACGYTQAEVALLGNSNQTAIQRHTRKFYAPLREAMQAALSWAR